MKMSTLALNLNISSNIFMELDTTNVTTKIKKIGDNKLINKAVIDVSVKCNK